MDDDLDPAYNHETAIADLSRISGWLVDLSDAYVMGVLFEPPAFEDCQSAAADLHQVLAWLKSNAPTDWRQVAKDYLTPADQRTNVQRVRETYLLDPSMSHSEYGRLMLEAAEADLAAEAAAERPDEEE